MISNRYRVIGFLGGGSATEVFKVKDIVGGRVLALKILRENTPKEEEFRLNREFYYLSRFSHRGIVAVFDYGKTPDQRPYFTMEFIDGKPITSHFSGGYTPELEEITVQALQALDSIHSQGLIHCDLKPQHLLVVQGQGKPLTKLLDFGFAENIRLGEETTPRGTLGYVAPEVFKGGYADARADLYSLGMVLYETLTGQGPSKEKSLRDWLRKQYYSEFEPPRRFNPNIPERFEAVVMTLIRREPERRFISANAVIEALKGSGAGPAVPDRSEGPGFVPKRYLMVPGFVGRGQFLQELKSRLELAGQSKPGVVCISGERGVGKSRLLSEFKFLAQLEGAAIFAAEPGSLGARPQSLIETVLNYLRIYSPGPMLQLDECRATDAEDGKFRLFEMVTQRLKEVSGSHRVGHCLVLLVDDFELFDPTSLEFLRYLGFSLENERLLVVVAGLKEKRFIDLIAELGRKDYCQHLSLPPMERREITGLVTSLLGDLPAAESLVEWLMNTTGGNPLFVIETIYSLIDEKILLSRSGRWNLTQDRLAGYRPPDTVTDVVRRRLDSLTPEELEVLQIGASAGGPWTLEFLRAVLNYDDKVLFNAVSRLKALGLLRGFASDGEGAFILSSKILEAVVTERLPVEKRRELHRRVALALELLYPEKQDRLVFDLAHHYTQAGIKDRAFSYSLRAGAQAKGYRLFEQALGYYETALALSPQLVPARERIGLIETVGELREATGRFQEALDCYTQGMGIIVADRELVRERQLLARFLRRLGLVHQKQARNEEALNFFNQALLMLAEKESVEFAQLLNDLGWSYCSVGNFDRAEAVLTQALQVSERLPNTCSGRSVTIQQLQAQTLYYFSVLAWSRYDFVLALQLAERTLAIYETIRDDYNIGKVSQFIATLWWRRGELAKARECYQRCLPVQRKSGEVYWLLRSLQGLGIISLDEGEWHQAFDYFTEAYTLAERIGDTPALAELSINLGVVCDELGEWGRASAHLEEAIELHNRSGVEIRRFDKAGARIALSQLRAKQGELEEAERLMKEAAALVEGTDDPELNYHLAAAQAALSLRMERFDQARSFLVKAFNFARKERDWRKLANLFTIAAELRLLTGDASRADGAARKALLLLHDYPTSKEYAVALRFSGLAKCLLDRPERGTQELRRSIELLRPLSSKFELARSLLASAQALTRPGRWESREPGRAVPTPQLSLTFRPVPQQELNEALANLREAQELFRTLGARLELGEAEELMAMMIQLSATMQLKARERGEYLKVFYQLAELINLDLEKEDFLERVLDLVIEVTKAERGLLFLVQGDRLVPVAARNVDHATLEDAATVSNSVLRKVRRRSELIFSADAMADPRFANSNSVMLNKIRSLLCAPLRVENKVIGTIYLDSRVTVHLFLEEDQNLLMSVANLLAATIDKSVAFNRLQEEMSAIREDIMVDAVTGLFLGRAKSMREVYRIIEKIAPTDCTVLLTGETGTGKGVLARLIHSKSERSGNRFVAINCGTLPETLFESELFGHVRGSFTGAVRDKEGLFETAENGTIFLDEISNITLGTQAKLLQVLEEKVIRRVGETATRTVDVRLICATNRNLEEEVAAGRFREDLLYRINVVTIHVPPLRERVGDIPQLANYFLRRYATQLNKPVAGFDDSAIAAFTNYQWPGNVRELQNVIERAVIMTQKRRIGLDDLGPKFAARTNLPSGEENRRRVIDRNQVLDALKETNGNISRAAALLSTHRRQLQRLIKRYRIDRSEIS
ncbi:MAG: sigma 54-interacting transcriptional regulator [candidate division WOR-3 bacterium]